MRCFQGSKPDPGAGGRVAAAADANILQTARPGHAMPAGLSHARSRVETDFAVLPSAVDSRRRRRGDAPPGCSSRLDDVDRIAAMSRANIDIERLSTAARLELLERLWDSLSPD